jgi:hypothetical protein
MIDIDSTDFAKLVKEVANVEPEFRKSVRKMLKEKADPIVNEVKQAVLATPSHKGEAETGRKKRGENQGLRASLASAVVAEINPTKKGAIAKIRVSTTKFMSNSGRPRTIPYYYEGRRKRAWRHPVFGDREVWVEQKPHPFLGVTVAPHKQEFASAVVEALDEAIQSSGILNRGA